MNNIVFSNKVANCKAVTHHINVVSWGWFLHNENRNIVSHLRIGVKIPSNIELGCYNIHTNVTNWKTTCTSINDIFFEY